MSFLAGRLAATEGAYFLQESKLAASRLANKNKILRPPKPHLLNDNPHAIAAASTAAATSGEAADVLPEILRHSIPLKAEPSESDPSLSRASKWALSPSSNISAASSSPDKLNPLRAFVSLPQATFGPKRWQLQHEQPTVSASTANDLRQDRYSQVDSKKLKALAAGYSQIAKAFAVATTIVFGGAATVFVYTARKLQMESADDIKTKGKDLIQPRADMLKEQIVPLRVWAENTARKWHIESGRENKEKSIVKELSKTLGPRTSG